MSAFKPRYDTPREALEAFEAGEIDAEYVRERFGDVDGIERSLAVARAQRTQTLPEDELEEVSSLDTDA